jgi:glycosyltransferase involved in cell wall biosynthesis
MTSSPYTARYAAPKFRDASVTIVIPVHNAATTLPEVFDGLERQENKGLVDRILLIDDCSTDESPVLLRDYAPRSSYATEVVEHARNRGIARTLNEGIGRAQTDIVVLMQADMQLTNDDSIARLISPLAADPTVIGAYAAQLHPLEVWRSYPFWQRCMFARFVDRQVRLFTPKFAALRRRNLIELGAFDEETFRVAGEDGDLQRRVERGGFRIELAPVAAVHLHSRDPHFGLRD